MQGALLAGASRIVAIDIAQDKLAAAAELGATDTILSDAGTALAVRDLVAGGVEFSFEAIGRRETAELAFDILAPGGVCTVLGMVPDSTPIRVAASELYFHEKTLRGAFIGSSRFTLDIPQLVEMYGRGRLKLDEMITHEVCFEDLNSAMSTLSTGIVGRMVVSMPLQS